MNAALMLEEGRLLRQQDRASAIDYYSKQMQKAAVCHDRELWLASTLTLAWELLESGKSDGGLIAQTLSVADPNDPYLRLAQARLRMSQGDFAAAIDVLTPEVSTIDDLELQGLLVDALAQCYAITHQFDKAKPLFDRAITLLSPASFYLGFSYLHRGEMYLFAQDFDQGEEAAQTAIEIALQTEDHLLRFYGLVLLVKIELQRQELEVASNLITDCQELIDPAIDLLESVVLALLQIEVFCQMGDAKSATSLWEYIAPLVGQLQDWRTQQQASYIKARVGIAQINAGLIGLHEDTVEEIEDILLNVAIEYEQRQMYSCQALVLLNAAGLYTIAAKLPTPYQFRGKSLRALEQAGVLLEKVGLKNTQLGRAVEELYDRILDNLSVTDNHQH
ncbi:MAG: hypothetical protein RMK91_04795 [Pseudanabaenaceae cyanobacterium SKYGB_i_bin29]|nr:hypothetical protein [Pseudanabaenaceae cyanobacterium SKYG29]MDW8421163.1 hypothetical protein [Pseudanabaenaceae cyanobacterium SKYGB_i_bin29]